MVREMQEMINYLKSLGLTDYQARAMLVLFCKGEATAKDICKYGGVRRTKIYQVLKSLEDHGFVKYNYSSPREYMGISASEVMSQLLEKIEEKITQLRKQKKSRVSELNSLELAPIKDSKIHPMWNTEQYKEL